jgi:hypothetical protein
MYEKIHFYTLDAVSRHGLDLPTFALDTMAFWLVPPEELLDEVRRAGLDAHSGLRGIGYATRMLLPLFMTCDTLDFSHSIGSANSPWQAIFVYERVWLGLGFTEKAYERLHEIMPAVLENTRNCPCRDGCPCCVGKPLRQYTTWNVERGEASIPSKASARMILKGLLGDGSNLENPDSASLADTEADAALRAERALRRRLERMREPQVFHPIEPRIETGYPEPERAEELERADSGERRARRRSFHRELRKRIAKSVPTDKLKPHAGIRRPPPGMKSRGSNAPPTRFPGRPEKGREEAEEIVADEKADAAAPIRLGDSLAARARKLRKRREDGD